MTRPRRISRPDEGHDASAKWRQVSTAVVTMGLGDLSSFDLDTQVAPDISRLLDSGEDQPLGHDLLREAWNIHESNPRSAVVIAVAAIEVGIKQFIAAQLPGTKWLLHHMPAPPVHKLLRDFLPGVPSRGESSGVVGPLDIGLVRVLREAVEQRNALVHAGEANISEDWLQTLFKNVRRLLYDLDYHRGHGWARAVRENVQPWGR